LTALSAEFTIGEGELMAHDVPLGCAPDEYDDLISGTCSHLPYHNSSMQPSSLTMKNLHILLSSMTDKTFLQKKVRVCSF
ncbi:hypothetical protein, partial [Escherichia coli]